MPMRITHRGYLVYSHDIIMTVLSFYISLYLRLGDQLLGYFSPETLVFGGALFGIISAGVYLYQDLYRGVWRYASLNDLIAITRAVTLVVLIFLLVLFLPISFCTGVYHTQYYVSSRIHNACLEMPD